MSANSSTAYMLTCARWNANGCAYALAKKKFSERRPILPSEGKKEQQAKIKEMEKKLDALLRDFEYHAREMVTALQDRAAAQKLSKDAERRISKLRREFREQFDSTIVAHSTGADQGDPHAQPQLVKHVSEGDTVKLKSVGRPAVVARRIDDNHFEVEIGAMKMKIARDDIAEVLVHASDSPVKAARARGISVLLESENQSMSSEINVIGRTVDDATREVEKFVDRAFLAGLPRVRVVHGSGMGILRKALRQYLQKHPHVESVIEPPQNEGGGVRNRRGVASLVHHTRIVIPSEARNLLSLGAAKMPAERLSRQIHSVLMFKRHIQALKGRYSIRPFG